MCVKLNFRARAGQDSTGAITRAVDPDPHGSAFIFPPESGSAFNMRIRILEGKFVNYKLKKCKKFANNCNLIMFF